LSLNLPAATRTGITFICAATTCLETVILVSLLQQPFAAVSQQVPAASLSA